MVLAFPDRNKPYILYTDASDTVVGAMLCQEDDEKRLRLVVCMSRKLNKHEVNYPVHGKELLALVESTTKWRHCLHGLQVIVYTDSSALKYLQTMSKPSTLQIRWLHRLQEFDLSIHHIPGKTNIVADLLS